MYADDPDLAHEPDARRAQNTGDLQDAHKGRVPWAGLLLLVAVFVALVAANPERIDRDCAQYLQTGQMILRGGVPFVDFYDTNPPLIMYLNVIPAALAQVLGAPIVAVFLLCVLALTLWSAALTYRLLSRAFSVSHSQACAIPAALLLLSLLMLATRDYGQREHLLALLVVPFLLLRALRWSGRLPTEGPAVRGIALGAAAGVGLCLKPHFLLVIVLCELYGVVSRRRLRPLLASELLALGGTVVCYGVWLRWLMPLPAREAFWGPILLLVRQGYGAYNNSAGELADWTHPLWTVVAVGLGGLFARRHCTRACGDLVAPFAVAALASSAVYLLQGKLWLYQLVPGLACAAIVISLLYTDLRERVSATAATAPSRGTQPLVPWHLGRLLALSVAAVMLEPLSPRVGWLCLLLAIAYWDLRRQGGQRRPDTPASRSARGRFARVLPYAAAGLLCVIGGVWTGQARPREVSAAQEAILRYSRPGDRVLVLSTSVANPPYPALLWTGRFQASRYLCAWPISALYREVRLSADGQFPYRDAQAAPELERQFLEVLREDVQRYRPPLVLVKCRGPFQGCPGGFNLLTYFVRSGFTEQALSAYEWRGTADEFAVYTRAR